MSKVKVSIIIVYYSGRDIFSCIAAIRTSKPKTSYEIIVVDNSLKENKKLSKIKGIKYIKSEKNGGYGYGNNLGVSIAKSKYIFILNPDTYLKKGTLDKLVMFLDKHKDVALVGPNLLHPDGTLYKYIGSRELNPVSGAMSHSFVNSILPNNPVSKKYYLLDTDFTKPREVFAAPGCAILIRKNIFENLRGYDENIFLYFEEADLGKRLQNQGYKSFIIPESEVIHKKTFDLNPDLKKYNTKSRFYFFKKHYGIFSAIFVEIFCRFSRKKALVGLCIIALLLIIVYIW